MTGTVKAPSAHDQTTDQTGTNQAINHGYLYDHNKPQQGTGPSRRGEVEGLVTLGLATFGGSAVAQKYKVHQNAPFSKKVQKIFPQRGPTKM